MIFEYLTSTSSLMGFLTLIILELVLGIDNLIFIAILTDRLPESQRHRARTIGLLLAMIMRLFLLASLSWIVTLTKPLFSLFGVSFAARNLILSLGGMFLLFKGTTELHERLEGGRQTKPIRMRAALFWQVIIQIIVLDAIFSLDSVITAVGMMNELSMMVVAVIIAVTITIICSKPLMIFVSEHPTVIILCLGFLMMIGFSLLLEGVGFYVHKGYLYAAIGFSILVELCNQIAKYKQVKTFRKEDMRDRIAEGVLRLMGVKPSETSLSLGDTADTIAKQAANRRLFHREEREMIQAVLMLANRPISSIMTPRTELEWLDLRADPANIRERIIHHSHSRWLVAKGSPDKFLGIALARDLLRDLLVDRKVNWKKSVRKPLIVHESAGVLRVMEQLRTSPLQTAVILDEYGALEGIATPTDILEAIAGDFPDEGETETLSYQLPDGSWLMDGALDVRRASHLLGSNLIDEANRYLTLAGFILWQLPDLPKTGLRLLSHDYIFEILSMKGRNIERVKVFRPDVEGESVDFVGDEQN